MPTQLRWLVSTKAASLHAAEALTRAAPLADRHTAEAIAEEARGLLLDLDNLAVPRERFFEHAVALATRIDAPGQWARVVLSKLLGGARVGDLDQQLARRFIALEAAFSVANPRAAGDLELRSQPLREQWEARGPGLLAAMARRTEAELLVESADVILVQPVTGGGGRSHPLYNSVRIETVLTNPLPELPEVVRLAWLLAQLNRDVPRFQGALSGEPLFEAWRLAMIPPVLAAAEEVELARFDRPTLDVALAAWTNTSDKAVGETLACWWETFQESKPAWPVALGALGQMLDNV